MLQSKICLISGILLLVIDKKSIYDILCEN